MRRFLFVIVLISCLYYLINRYIQTTNILFLVLLLLIIALILLYVLVNKYKHLYHKQNESINAVLENHIHPTIIHPRVIRVPLEDQVDLTIEDEHNVHNKTIKRTAAVAIKNLKKCDNKLWNNINTTISNIHECASNLNLNNKQQIRENLSLMQNLNAYYKNGKISEMELIRLIWCRIHDPINQSVMKTLKENFYNQLIDCGNGERNLHCLEGRITRLIQSLQHCDVENLVDLKPMWAFRDEIVNKIQQYQKKLIERAPPIYSDLIDLIDPNESQKLLLKKFNDCLVKNLNRRFDIDYIQSNYLTQLELNDITQVYYDSLYDN